MRNIYLVSCINWVEPRSRPYQNSILSDSDSIIPRWRIISRDHLVKWNSCLWTQRLDINKSMEFWSQHLNWKQWAPPDGGQWCNKWSEHDERQKSNIKPPVFSSPAGGRSSCAVSTFTVIQLFLYLMNVVVISIMSNLYCKLSCNLLILILILGWEIIP